MSYRKEDWGYTPSDKELVKSYAERMKSISQQIRHDYTQNHLKWYTHYSSGPCFICNLMDLLDFTIEIAEMVPTTDTKGSWSINKLAGNDNMHAFSLTRRKT